MADALVELADLLAGRSHSPVVYFIRLGERVKIGTTTNLMKRVSALSLTLSEVTHILPGGEEVERRLHRRWSRYRVHRNREWFHAKGSLADFLGPYSPAKPRSTHPLARRLAHRIPPARTRFTLAEISRRGTVPMRADALRQAKRRDPSFPLGTMEKGGTFYTEDEIRAWYQHRKRGQNGQVPFS